MNERVSQTTEYHKIMELLRNEEIDHLARTKELGTTLDFSSALPQLREMVQYFESFTNSDLDRLPVQSIQALTATCRQLLGVISEIKGFGPGVTNALNAHSGILNTVDQTHYQILQTLAPMIAMLRYRRSEDGSGLGSAELSERLVELDSKLERSGNQLHEIDKILESSRQFAAESVVGQQASVFLMQSVTHAETAKKWLIALFALLAATLAAAIFSYFYTPLVLANSSGYGSIVFLLASKSVIFGLLIFSVVVAARNYSAHRHNEVINKHRHNALLTYNTFVSAGSTPEMRDIVLNHASTAIYGPADTGYNKHPEIPSTMLPVLNLPLSKQS